MDSLFVGMGGQISNNLITEFGNIAHFVHNILALEQDKNPLHAAHRKIGF
jgi:hypothetical protein